MGHIKLWMIVIEPEQYYGVPNYLIYQNGDKAIKKFHELIAKYNLDIVGLLKNCAITGTDGDHKHINCITIEPYYTCD